MDFANALYALRQSTDAYKPDAAQIRPLAEFFFEHKQQDGKVATTDYLLLAQLRLDSNDLAGALDVLRQLSLQPADIALVVQPGIDYTEMNTPSFAANSAQNPYVNIDSAAALLEKAHHPAEALPFLQSLTQLEPWNATYRLRLAEAQRDSGGRDQAEPNLIAVAKDASAAYDTRVKAARDLAAYPDAGDLTSSELTLVAHPRNLDAARQPYFNAARVALAAQATTTAKDRDALLHEVIAIAPNGLDSDRNRLDLLLAQPAGADASATLAILKSIQNPPQTNDYAGNLDENATASADVADTTPTYEEVPPTAAAIALPALASTLDLPTQTQLATLLASASQRDGDLATAVHYAQLAVDLNEAHQPDPALIHRRDELKMQFALEQRNATRRPHLQNALAQSTQVRPRLTASALAKEDAQ
jgi:hypothetical protein